MTFNSLSLVGFISYNEYMYRQMHGSVGLSNAVIASVCVTIHPNLSVNSAYWEPCLTLKKIGIHSHSNSFQKPILDTTFRFSLKFQ